MNLKFLFVFVLIASMAFADIGPKPTALFEVTYNGQSVSDESFRAKMLECGDSEDISIYHDYYLNETFPEQLRIEEYDASKGCTWIPAKVAWGGDCSDSHCHFSYFLPTDFKLAVYLPSQDKVFVSSEVHRTNFNSIFKTDLRTDGTIALTESSSIFQSDTIAMLLGFSVVMIANLALELITAFAIVSVFKIKKTVLKAVAIANIISLPVLWLVLPALNVFSLEIFTAAELCVVVFEGWLIRAMNKKELSLKKSLALSLAMNVISVVIGGLILLALTSVFYGF